MQDLSSSVLDDEQTIEQLESHGRHSKEIHRYDSLTVVLEERQPTLIGVPASPHSAQIPSHASFGNDKAQFLEFSMNSRSTPTRVLFSQAANQRSDFRGCSRPAAVSLRPPPPEESESRPVPADDRLGLHDDQHIGHKRRKVVQNHRPTVRIRGRGRFRWSTASCCRRARISRALSARLRKKIRTVAARLRMNAKNRTLQDSLYWHHCTNGPGFATH